MASKARAGTLIASQTGMLSSRKLALLTLLPAALGACHTEEIAPHTAQSPTIRASDAPRTSPSKSPVNLGIGQDFQPKPGLGREVPSLSLEQVEGADLARTRTVFAEVPERVTRCAPGSRGTLSVRVTSTEDHTKLSVETPGTLDRENRRCVLENLSVVDHDGVLSQRNSSDRPSGFSALIHIAW